MPEQEFDYVVIGSGPAAVAALQAFGPNRSIGVISGTSQIPISHREVHPKIQAVSVQNREAPGVQAAYSRSECPDKPLCSSAIIGGLANYWGQQFTRYEPDDKWPRDIFRDFRAYEAECGSIEQAFVRSGGNEIRDFERAAGKYRIRIPQLLTGCESHPKSGLMAMRYAVHDEIGRTGASLLEGRAQMLRKKGSCWEIWLESGQSIHGKMVILAAGVIGTGKLIANSFRTITEIEFSDHSPWMLYTTGLRALYKERPSNMQNHFNALTMERIEDSSTLMFASLYDMRQADLNLLLASTIGRTANALRGVRAPIGSQFLKPIQIWTPTSFDTITVDLKERMSRSTSTLVREPGKDETLAQTVSTLNMLGARCLKVSPTAPGYGFHYHNLCIKEGRKSAINIGDFLWERFGDSIRCVDASILRQIGLRPHTLTSMATSKSLTRELIRIIN